MDAPIIITAGNKQLYEEWFVKAMSDDGVWPYLSFDKRYAANGIESDDWDRVVLMDATRTAVMLWRQNRSNGMYDAGISLWSLSRPNKRLAAGVLLRQVPTLARRYAVTYIDASCHQSNEDSAHMLTKRLGEPWGIEPNAAWNGLTGEWDNILRFRAKTLNGVLAPVKV